MPELPDVEVFKRYLDSTALHQPIEGVEVEEPDLLEGLSPQSLSQTLIGRELAATRRHGKWLFVEAPPRGGHGDSTWLVLHFGMTGFLSYYRNGNGAPEHIRLRLDFDDGYHLAYDDQRKFGEIHLIDDVDRFVEEKELGPDALDLGWEELRERLEGRRGAIKSTLMNQQVVAGIGNEYSDEILFQAHVHPQAEVAELSEERLREIHRRMQEVFEAAIAARCRPEDFPDRFLNKRREEGADCPGDCGGSIETIEVSGRTGYFCPRCQKKS